MRWLFILVLVFLVACVLSIIWMNDARRFPSGGQLDAPPPGAQNPLTGQPPTRNAPADTQ